MDLGASWQTYQVVLKAKMLYSKEVGQPKRSGYVQEDFKLALEPVPSLLSTLAQRRIC